jgi:AmpD protein
MTTNSKEMIINAKGFIKDIKHILSPNHDSRPKDSTINLLVIHNISLPPDQYGGDYIEHFFTNQLNSSIDPYFQKIKNIKVSSHFVINREGNLIQYVSCKNRAWHAGVSEWNGKKNCNDYSIGIELEGSDHIEYTESQYEKLNQLIDCLKLHYAIEDIVGHSDIAPGRKTDPGTSFDWKKIEY